MASKSPILVFSPRAEMKSKRKKYHNTVAAIPEHRQGSERVVMADIPDGNGMN